MTSNDAIGKRILLQIDFEAFTLLEYKTCNPPKYGFPSTSDKIIERLIKISKVFVPKADFKFNGKSRIAEEYALCLLEDGKAEKALELFEAIAENRDDLLFLHDSPANDVYVSEEISPMPGKLGFEGLMRYAKLLLEKNPERSRKLLLELVEKIPTKCYPIHLQDVRVEAFQLLQKLGVKKVGGSPIEKGLKEAKAHQY